MRILTILLAIIFLTSCGEELIPTVTPENGTGQKDTTSQGGVFDTTTVIDNGDTINNISEVIYKLDTAFEDIVIYSVPAQHLDSVIVNGKQISKLRYVENFTSCCSNCGVYTLSFWWDEYITPTKRVRHKIGEVWERSNQFTTPNVVKIKMSFYVNGAPAWEPIEWYGYGFENINIKVYYNA